LDDLQRAQWLCTVTGETTMRGVARKVGVSHTTVQRWINSGVPPSTVWDITLRFNGDPIAALVVMGRIEPDEVQRLNLAAIVRYADADILTAELHARAMRERVKTERSDAFDGAPFVLEDENPPTGQSRGSLGRSDTLTRQSFRLTGKER
jgi:hypothetical protein